MQPRLKTDTFALSAFLLDGKAVSQVTLARVADQALSLIEVDYEVLPAVADPATPLRRLRAAMVAVAGVGVGLGVYETGRRTAAVRG